MYTIAEKEVPTQSVHYWAQSVLKTPKKSKLNQLEEMETLFVFDDFMYDWYLKLILVQIPLSGWCKNLYIEIGLCQIEIGINLQLCIISAYV
jgi:hypothetical protein